MPVIFDTSGSMPLTFDTSGSMPVALLTLAQSTDQATVNCHIAGNGSYAMMTEFGSGNDAMATEVSC